MRFLLSINCLTLFFALQALAAESPQAAEAAVPPTMPAVRSPVDALRELLEMAPAERAQALSQKSARKRKVIEDGLKELEALPLQQRQSRLRLMQLRWELLLLVQTPVANRSTLLSMVPEQDRRLVQQRLQIWDGLSTNQQKLILENEMVMHMFITGRASTLELTNKAAVLSPEMLGKIKLWRDLSPDQQRQAYDSFRQIFGLAERERDKLLGENLFAGHSQTDRDRIERFLKSFEKLPAAEREKRMASFQRFTSMTMEQRTRFLENAERWEAMSELDREAMRTMMREGPPIPPLPDSFFSSGLTNAAYSTNR